MKKKSVTLREFIKIFDSEFEAKDCRIPENWKELSYSEKFELCKNGVYDIIYRCRKVSDDVIMFYHNYYTIKRVGKNIFKKCETHYIRITPNKITTTINDVNIIKCFLLRITSGWFKDLNPSLLHCFIHKPSVIRAIITNKVYSEETFCKFIMKYFYKINVNWKVFRDFILNAPCVSHVLYDLAAFTKNVEISMKVILEKQSYRQMMWDILDCAVKLNQVVDFSWSEKRMHEEHQKQISLLQAQTISTKEQTPIFKNIVETDSIKLLNTEKDIYLEGTNMHHCLYNCYYHRIVGKNYIAFHMTVPEDCTFGICKRNGEVVLDQIYLKYDQHVSYSTRELAEQFIEENKEILSLMFEEDCNEDICDICDTVENPNRGIDTILPW